MDNEHVQISLDRYHDFLDDNKKANLLYEIKKDLIEIIDDENFELEDPIHSKIFDIYARLCNEI